MRRLALLLSAAVLVGCSKKEPEPAPPAAEPVAPPAPAPIDLNAVAGTWEMKTMPAAGDSVLTTFTLVATADTAGWVMTLPKRKPVALKITVSGDSVMSEAPQYESVLRKGVKVTTTSVFHLVGDKLMGTTTARYVTSGADSVVMLRSEGMKVQK